MPTSYFLFKHCTIYAAIWLSVVGTTQLIGNKAESIFYGLPVSVLLASIFGYPPFALSRVFYAQFKKRVWSVYSQLTVIFGAGLATGLFYEANLISNDYSGGLLYVVTGLLVSTVSSLIIICQATLSNAQKWFTRIIGSMAALGTLVICALMAVFYFGKTNLEPYSLAIHGVIFFTLGAATIALLLSVFAGLKPEFINEKGRMLDAAS